MKSFWRTVNFVEIDETTMTGGAFGQMFYVPINLAQYQKAGSQTLHSKSNWTVSVWTGYSFFTRTRIACEDRNVFRFVLRLGFVWRHEVTQSRLETVHVSKQRET